MKREDVRSPSRQALQDVDVWFTGATAPQALMTARADRGPLCSKVRLKACAPCHAALPSSCGAAHSGAAARSAAAARALLSRVICRLVHHNAGALVGQLLEVAVREVRVGQLVSTQLQSQEQECLRGGGCLRACQGAGKDAQSHKVCSLQRRSPIDAHASARRPTNGSAPGHHHLSPHLPWRPCRRRR
jgi:hypothetical protein